MYQQPRRPRGADGAGQFSEVPRAEVDVELRHVAAPVSDDEYNAEGTFEFPPVARSYGQLVSFWTKVKVADQVIRQMTQAYTEHMSEQHMAAAQEWLAQNPEPSRYTKGRFGRPDEPNPAHEEWTDAYQDELARLNAIHPLTIEPSMARALARAARMRWQAQRAEAWLPGITDQVDATTIEVPGTGPNGESRPVSVAEMLERFPVDELDEAVWRDQTAETLEFIARRLDDLSPGA